jgi:hypothetical protein
LLGESRSQPSFPLPQELPPRTESYALSIKQPWAALIVAQVKTIEVRTWSTQIRGRIWIHAGKVPDSRPAGWQYVSTPALEAAAQQLGGIIGSADLTACHAYHTREEFAASQTWHRNELEWFRPPVLYGFEFREAQPVPFVPCKGQTMFFKVEGASAS